MTQIQENKIQELHRQKYLSSIQLLPDLRQQKVKEYLQVIFTLVALIIAIIFAIKPTLTTISDLNRQITDATHVYNALQTKVNNLSKLSAQYVSLQSDFPNIEAAVPKSEDAQLLLAALQSLAQKHNLTITGLSTQLDTKQDTQKYRVLTFNISADGSYADILSFLNDSVTFQRIILPVSINLTKNTDTSSNAINVTLSGNAYYQL